MRKITWQFISYEKCYELIKTLLYMYCMKRVYVSVIVSDFNLKSAICINPTLAGDIAYTSDTLPFLKFHQK